MMRRWNKMERARECMSLQRSVEDALDIVSDGMV